MPEVRELLRIALGDERPSGDLLEGTRRRAARRERRRRLAAGGVAALALLVVGLSLWIALLPSTPGPPVGTPTVPTTTGPAPSPSATDTPTAPSSPTARPSATAPPPRATPTFPPAFVPATTAEGGRVVMRVVIPDGTTATLRFPRSLDLAEIGVSPEIGYYLGRGDATSGPYPLVLVHGHTTAGLVKGDGPIATFDDPGGPIELWEMAPNAEGLSWPTTAWLVEELEDWTVFTYVPEFPNGAATVEGARQIATWLHPEQTADGFVVVTATGDARMSTDYGEGLGAELAFGDRDPRGSYVRTEGGFRVVEITAARFPCTPGNENVGGDTRYASTCIGEGPGASLFVAVNGPAEFVRDVVDGLEATDVHISKI
jgi:hypothetical protein